jgi:hypothetical protein
MKANLAHDHALKAGHVALLSGNFEVSVDDSHGKENTCAAAQSTKKIATNRQSSNAGTTESSRGRNDTLELLVHGLLTVTSHDQTLLLELLSDIAGRRAGNLDPGLREDSASDEHVDDEDSGLQGVGESLGDAERGRPGAN